MLCTNCNGLGNVRIPNISGVLAHQRDQQHLGKQIECQSCGGSGHTTRSTRAGGMQRPFVPARTGFVGKVLFYSSISSKVWIQLTSALDAGGSVKFMQAAQTQSIRIESIEVQGTRVATAYAQEIAIIEVPFPVTIGVQVFRTA